ncbi:tyrosine-type recombinase/integrase [Lysinibacillus sp. NPDC097287]|uniref:tyrosine-type recombinase/integrase n=1 Tax=Lysinibacillus sp. NPDC097287 TaxID=3364144 RepID=UPI003813AEC3
MQNISKKYPQIKSYQLKDGTTVFRFTVYLGVDPLTGKEKIVTRSKFKTVKQAELAIEKLKFEFSNGLNPANMLKTFNDSFIKWDASYKASGIVMSTYSKTEGYIKNHILPFFGDKKLSKITVAMCEQFALELSKKLKYFHHIVNYASDVMETAIRHGDIHSNPFKSAKIPKETAHQKSDNFIDIIDFKKLLSVLPNYDLMIQCLLRLLMFTGLRKGELLVLTWSDVDFDKKKLLVHSGYSYSKHNNGNNVGLTKGKLIRTILLDSNTLGLLKTWKQLQVERLDQLGISRKPDTEQVIFNNTVNNYLKLNYPNDYLKTAIEEANIKSITVHGLRHTHITHLREAEADFFVVQERVGHSQTNNTTDKHYTHVTDTLRENTLQKLLNYYKKFDIE